MTREQFREVMDFSRSCAGHLAVHCRQGQSRSTAVALAILADRLNDVDQAIAAILKDATRRVMPNPGIVAQIEAELGFTGLDARLLTTCPDYKWWRSNWIAEGWKPPQT